VDEIIRRITVIGTGPSGPSAEVLFEKGSKRRKSSRLLKPVERVQRRVLKAQKAFADEALALHEKRARKRKDGWLRDAPMIVFKANRKALKRLTDW
jgi:Family of unknown function (DUF6312)